MQIPKDKIKKMQDFVDKHKDELQENVEQVIDVYESAKEIGQEVWPPEIEEELIIQQQRQLVSKAELVQQSSRSVWASAEKPCSGPDTQKDRRSCSMA